MTDLMVKLPDELARRAKSAGLLTDSAIQRLLEQAMRREAGRRLLQVAERLHAAGVDAISEEVGRHALQAARSGSGRRCRSRRFRGLAPVVDGSLQAKQAPRATPSLIPQRKRIGLCSARKRFNSHSSPNSRRSPVRRSCTRKRRRPCSSVTRSR